MLVIGSVARDTIHNPSGTFPYILGGSAVFASIAARYFSKVAMVGVVGTDFPKEEVELLTQCGIDLSGLEVSEGETFHWEGRYSADLSSRESLKTELNVFASFRPKIPETQKNTPYVMLGNIDPELQIDVLNQLTQPKYVIADTMNFWISGKPAALTKLLQRVDLLVVNEEEARQLGGTNNVYRAAQTLLGMGPRALVIKRGEYGALLFHGGDVFSAPAFPVEEVRDPTGCGDTFAGGLLGYVARENKLDGATLRRAVIYGSVLASFCVEGIGVQRLLHVTNAEIAARFATFARLSHFATEAELKGTAALGGAQQSA